MDKVERKNEACLLQSLPILERSWQYLSMNFISAFPTVNEFENVLVVVDRFFKYFIFMMVLLNVQLKKLRYYSLTML